MSRDIAQSGSSPLTAELFHASVYKPNQGRIVRQLTALTIWIVVALGCWRLYSSLRGVFNAENWTTHLTLAIPAVLLTAGLWIGYRLVNWPRFADFLIAVEAEMNKVTWPSKDELIRASIVVMFTIFFLAMALFVFDIVWQTIFNFIGVTS
ncbi:MAG: preprotein translocase subunit SecE [Pirellulaceae bacterium]|nr:preprotein translocase subunit SecE [Pirellulaceae bacterium]